MLAEDSLLNQRKCQSKQYYEQLRTYHYKDTNYLVYILSNYKILNRFLPNFITVKQIGPRKRKSKKILNQLP